MIVAPIPKNQLSFAAEWCARSELPLWDHTAHTNGLNFVFFALLGKIQLLSLSFLQPKSEIFSPQAAG